MTTVEVTFQNQKCSGHVVVAMWNHRATFVQSKHLMPEDKFCGQALNFRQSGLKAQFASLFEFHFGCQLFEINELQQLRKIDLAEEFFYLLLPFQLFKLFPLQIKTHRVEFCQPLRCDRTNIAGKRISGKQRVEKRPRQQCSQSLLMKLTPRW